MNWVEYRNKILADLDYEAFLRSELTGIQSRGTEWKCQCPQAHMHEGGVDKNPSCTVNVSKGVFYCNVCGFKGNVHTLYRTIYNLTSEQAWFELGDALGIDRPTSTKPTRPDIDISLVAQYHQALMKLTGPIRQVLRVKRGLTDDTLRRFQLGWDGERITIPIYDEFNNLVNFRLYKWNSDEDQYKVTNYVDEFGNSYGEVRIFGIENLIDENVSDVVWCEGEMDRICAEQHGFSAACPTSGAGTWKPEWLKFFRNKKKVILAQDNDEAGRVATAKLCDKMYSTVDVYMLQWPEEFPKKGDVTDFFTKCNQTSNDFQKLLDEALKYDVASDTPRLADESDVPEVSLVASGNAKYYGKRIKVPVLVSGKMETPYVYPSIVDLHCGENADAENKACYGCGLLEHAGDYTKRIGAPDKEILSMINCSEDQQIIEIKKAVGVKLKCSKCKVFVRDRGNLEEVRMVPKADSSFSTSKDNDYVVRTGYTLSSAIKSNSRYTLVGYPFTNPKSQSVSYVFDKMYPDKDIVSEFEMTPEIHEMLQSLQPAEGQSVHDKIEEIHRDLERNVTRVWNRRDVAKGVDLVYHSVQSFYFQGVSILRGWAELLIIGDSGQAKSTLVEQLMQHYGLGEKLSGESAKRTGLLYSMQQNNGRWFLVWGALPLNDGGLVTIDELSGLSEDDLGLMSEVRSSGKARATGVVTTETNSRTRVIYISNPRNGKQLNTETYGVEAIAKLFGKAEDVRRLDMAMAVASGDVDASLVNVNTNDIEPVPHKVTSEIRKNSVMWAWSRRPDDIVFADGSTELILKLATEMGRKYNSAIPLVEAADQRLKIARLAIACACSLYSTEDGEKVIVTPEHVQYVVDFLNKIYSHKSLGYDRYSNDKNINSDDSDDNLARLRTKFLSLPITDHAEMAKVLYQLPYFSRATLEDYTGLSRDDLKVLLKFLTTEHIVERVRGDYRRYPLGTALLTDIINRPITKQELDKVKKEYYMSEY